MLHTFNGISSWIKVLGLCLFAAGFCWSPASAAMLNQDSLLSPEQEEELSTAARENYEEAKKFADRANYDVALRYMEDAFNEQDDHVELNFLLARLAVNRARLSFGDESVEHYDLAEKALKANLKIKKLSFVQRQRCEKALEVVEEERKEVPQRDKRRREIGKLFIEEQLSYRSQDKEASSDKDKSSSGGEASSSSSSTGIEVSPQSFK